MDIRLFQENQSDPKLWDDFVLNHPQAASDHLWGWRKILEKSFGFRNPLYLGTFENGRLEGILPLFRVPKGLRGSALCSIPFANYGGVCTNSQKASGLLLEKASQLLKETGSHYLELRQQTPLEGVSAKLKPSKNTHARYVQPLEKGSQAIWHALRPRIRNIIRNAQKAGLSAFDSRDVNKMYPIHLHTTQRQGVPSFPKIYFKSMLEAFGENAKITFVKKNEKLIAFYFLIYFKGSVVNQFAGSLASDYGSHPNEFLFWHTIEESCRMGLKEFDFCKSRIASTTADYKRRLRLEEIPCNSQFIFPENYQEIGEETNSKKNLVWLSKAWRRIPSQFTRPLSPVILRYFA